MHVVRVDEIADIVMGQSPPGSSYNETGCGLPFFQGKAEFGEISPIAKKWCNDPKRLAEAGDILMSVRAPVGPTNVASERCCIGRGLAAVRANATKIDQGFLRYFLRFSESRLARLGQGSTFAAIGRAEIASLMLRLPSIAEQRRIVDLLSRAEGIVRLRREAQRKTAELIPAIFLDLFGDPASNPKRWPLVAFGELGQLDRGKSRHRPRDAQELYDGPYPFIQTGDVANSGGHIVRYEQTYSELGLAQSRLWPSGTLCITIAANIARTGVLDFDACFPDSVVGFTPSHDVTVDYIQHWLGFLQPTLEMNAPQAAQKNINLNILRNLPVPVPPVDLQHRFAAKVEAVRGIVARQTTALATAQAAFDALLHQAFA
ncbi:MAG TPA: restriction endonuclease subunit S [Rhodanobacteraceae bacterium]|nr:restriction endonuclease subunit S [Rhodanobacteraceae bacterium]